MFFNCVLKRTHGLLERGAMRLKRSLIFVFIAHFSPYHGRIVRLAIKWDM